MNAKLFWVRAPFLRILLPLILGIMLQYYLAPSITVVAAVAAALLLFQIVFRYIPLRHKQKFAILQGFTLQLLLVCVGFFLCWQKDCKNEPAYFGYYQDSSSKIRFRLEENPREKENSYKAEASVISLTKDSTTTLTKGRVIIYFQKDSIAKTLVYGDEILAINKLSATHNAGNPGGFDFVKYAARQQIYYTGYLRTGDFVKSDQNSAAILKKTVLNSKTWLLKTLKQSLPENENVLAIASALIIGEKQDIDRDLLQAYSHAGIVHLIAISGMHLGMLYGMLLLLFNALPGIKKSRHKVIPIIILLWAFAFITGGSASVLRSALMFSFMLVGRNYFRQVSTYNTLAVSAFILLCYNPFYLWDVGFQLSYLAVTGIVWLQLPINNWIYFNNKIARYFWSIASVSLAAQLFTFPIALYYFHQFPLLFLLINLLTIPLAFVALCGGIILLAVSFIPILSSLMGYVVFAAIYCMNAIVNFANTLSFVTWDGLFASLTSTLLLYGFVFLLCFALINKKPAILKFSLGFLFLFALLITYAQIQFLRQKLIVFYNVPRMSAIEFISGRNTKFVGTDFLKENKALQDLHLKPSHIYYQLKNDGDTVTDFTAKPPFLFFHDKSVLLADSSTAYLPLKDPIPVDVLCLTRSFKKPLESLVLAVRPKIVLIDGTNSLWTIVKRKKECEALHLPCSALAEDGAYIINLNADK